MRPRIETPTEGGWVKPLVLAGTCVYLTAAATLLFNGRSSLLHSVTNYNPDLRWSIGTINQSRIDALLESGSPLLAYVYDKLILFSVIFTAFAVVVGLLGTLPKARHREIDPIALMTMTVGSVLACAAFSSGAAFLNLLWRAGALPLDLAGMPLFWFLSMICAATLTAWTAALLVHDIAVLALKPRTGSNPIAHF
jgi:hypothetical protein